MMLLGTYHVSNETGQVKLQWAKNINMGGNEVSTVTQCTGNVEHAE